MWCLTSISTGGMRTKYTLHLAATHGHAAVTDLLLAQNDVDVRAHNKERNTAIHLAHVEDTLIFCANFTSMNLLDQRLLGITAQNKHGHTPLHLAALGGFVDSVSYLRISQRWTCDVRMLLNTHLFISLHRKATWGCSWSCKFYRYGHHQHPALTSSQHLPLAARDTMMQLNFDLEHVAINQDCGDHGSALFVAARQAIDVRSLLVDHGARLEQQGKALHASCGARYLLLCSAGSDGILAGALKEDVLAVRRAEESMESGCRQR